MVRRVTRQRTDRPSAEPLIVRGSGTTSDAAKVLDLHVPEDAAAEEGHVELSAVRDLVTGVRRGTSLKPSQTSLSEEDARRFCKLAMTGSYLYDCITLRQSEKFIATHNDRAFAKVIRPLLHSELKGRLLRVFYLLVALALTVGFFFYGLSDPCETRAVELAPATGYKGDYTWIGPSEGMYTMSDLEQEGVTAIHAGDQFHFDGRSDEGAPLWFGLSSGELPNLSLAETGIVAHFNRVKSNHSEWSGGTGWAPVWRDSSAQQLVLPTGQARGGAIVFSQRAHDCSAPVNDAAKFGAACALLWVPVVLQLTRRAKLSGHPVGRFLLSATRLHTSQMQSVRVCADGVISPEGVYASKLLALGITVVSVICLQVPHVLAWFHGRSSLTPVISALRSMIVLSAVVSILGMGLHQLMAFTIGASQKLVSVCAAELAELCTSGYSNFAVRAFEANSVQTCHSVSASELAEIFDMRTMRTAVNNDSFPFNIEKPFLLDHDEKQFRDLPGYATEFYMADEDITVIFKKVYNKQPFQFVKKVCAFLIVFLYFLETVTLSFALGESYWVLFRCVWLASTWGTTSVFVAVFFERCCAFTETHLIGLFKLEAIVARSGGEEGQTHTILISPYPCVPAPSCCRFVLAILAGAMVLIAFFPILLCEGEIEIILGFRIEG